jgi:hypothetical protein
VGVTNHLYLRVKCNIHIIIFLRRVRTLRVRKVAPNRGRVSPVRLKVKLHLKRCEQQENDLYPEFFCGVDRRDAVENKLFLVMNDRLIYCVEQVSYLYSLWRVEIQSVRIPLIPYAAKRDLPLVGKLPSLLV